MRFSLIREIDSLWQNFTTARAYFPHTEPSLKGYRHWQTAPYYRDLLKLDIEFAVSRPLSERDISRNNSLGRWMNESVLVRLWAVLEYHAAVQPSVVDSLPCAGDIKLLCRLRNAIAHESGRYNSKRCWTCCAQEGPREAVVAAPASTAIFRV